MTSWLGDFTYAWRSLRAHRAIALIAIVTLALGIGANTALFSIVDAVLLRPLPFPQPEKLVSLWETTPDKWRVAPGTYLDWKREARGFEAIGAFRAAGATLTGAGEAERLDGVAATASYFEALAVRPALGRTVQTRDEQAQAEPVVVLSDELWRQRFAADPGVLGRVVALDGIATTIVGVMPAGLYPAWPTANGRFTVRGRSARYFVPMAQGPRFADNRRSHVLGLIGRLDAATDVQAAQTSLSALAQTLAGRHRENAGEGALVTPLAEEIVGDVRRALIVLLGAVGCVLALACANVASLLLARAAARGRELAIRRALGAGRARIVRLLLAESLLVALVGGLAGTLLATWSLPVVMAALPAELPRAAAAAIDARVLGFALALSLLTALLFGLAPALAAAAGDPLSQLRDGAANAGGAGRRRARTVLVTAQVALALALLTGGGLLLRSFEALRRVDPGFAADGVLTFDLVLPQRYASASQVTAAYAELMSRLQSLPGVAQAAFAYDTPLESNWIDAFEIEGLAPTAEGRSARLSIVSPGYFEALRVAVVRGRPLTAADTAETSGVVVVSESFVRRFLPGEDPLGRWLVIGTPSMMWGEAAPRRFQVVGVARDVRSTGLASGPEPTYHLAAAQFPQRDMSVLLKTAGEPLAQLSSVRAAVSAFDPELAPANATTLTREVDAQVAQPRFNTLVLAAFAGLALLLAAVGLHGLLSHAVLQRRRELGLRLALGARPAQLAVLVMGDGLRLVAIGGGIGLIASVLAGEVLETLLFGIGARDGVAYAVGVATLGFTALLASAGPAWRAAVTFPAAALKEE